MLEAAQPIPAVEVAGIKHLSEGVVQARVYKAFDILLIKDRLLFEYAVHEQTICGRLAMYLQELFPCYHVDVEYNLDGNHTKRLAGDAVRPDIIVHRRGNNASNILAMELKKGPVDPGDECRDHVKLRGYREELGYHFAVWVELPVGRIGNRVPRVEWM